MALFNSLVSRAPTQFFFLESLGFPHLFEVVRVLRRNTHLFGSWRRLMLYGCVDFCDTPFSPPFSAHLHRWSVHLHDSTRLGACRSRFLVTDWSTIVLYPSDSPRSSLSRRSVDEKPRFPSFISVTVSSSRGAVGPPSLSPCPSARCTKAPSTDTEKGRLRRPRRQPLTREVHEVSVKLGVETRGDGQRDVGRY